MKKCLMLIAAAMLAGAARAATEVVDGVTWEYEIRTLPSHETAHLSRSG